MQSAMPADGCKPESSGAKTGLFHNFSVAQSTLSVLGFADHLCLTAAQT